MKKKTVNEVIAIMSWRSKLKEVLEVADRLGVTEEELQCAITNLSPHNKVEDNLGHLFETRDELMASKMGISVEEYQKIKNIMSESHKKDSRRDE